jgi:ATP-binding cassette subfamily B protein
MFGPRRSRGKGASDNPDRPRGSDLGQIRHLARFLRPYRGTMAAALLALTISASAVLALGVGLRLLIDEGFSSSDVTLLNEALAYMIGMVVLLAVGTFARFYLVSWLGERVVADMRRAVFQRIVQLSPTFYETTKVGELLSRITTDTTLLQTVIGSQASSALRNLLLFLGGSVMLLVTSPKLTGLVVVLVPVVVVPIIILGRRVRRLSRVSQDRIGEVGANVEETLNAIQTVQAFGREPIVDERFSTRVEAAFSVALQRVRARAFLTAFVILFVFAGIGLVLWMGGHDVLNGNISGGELSAFLFYAVVVAGSVGSLSEVYGDLQHAAGAAERLAELLGQEPDITAPEAPTALPSPAKGAVSFAAVTFNYVTRPDEPALRQFTLDVAPGEHVALVGPSGAGKTTVFNLLLRFYDPSEGKVSVDGIDVREAEPSAVRDRFGLVPQEPIIFAADVWDNIRFGKSGATDASRREGRAAFRWPETASCHCACHLAKPTCAVAG